MVKGPSLEAVDSMGGAPTKLRQGQHLGVLFFQLSLGYTGQGEKSCSTRALAAS
jgi:hypothetical protein